MQEGDSQHPHYTGTKSEQQEFLRENEAPLIPEGQVLSVKDISGILDHQEKDGQQYCEN